jgi:hypothetical protein
LAATVLNGRSNRKLGGELMSATDLIVKLLPVLAFVAWCLWGIDWRKGWPILAMGGWIPLVLIAVMAGVVWSLVFPTPANVFGIIPIPNGLWQIGAVTLLVCLALACGWLQGQLGWYPSEIGFDPPAALHANSHAAH